MGEHQSGIDFRNLISDLAEMYPNEVAEVVIIELIANSLDAGADRISISFSPSKKALVVEDNGKGMSATQFSEYHDFAAGLKKRGTGIGFAGLGAKISFNVANRVITQTRSKSFQQGSDWYLKSKKQLVWKDVKPVHLTENGTRVEVYFKRDAEIPFASSKDIANILRKHYLPLTDSRFLLLYNDLGCYSEKLRFIVNGKLLEPGKIESDFKLSNSKKFCPAKAGKKYGFGIFGVSESEYPVSNDISGVLLCTYGKVIKADLFNQFPGNLGPRLFGVVEVPGFINFITTSKTDFMKSRKHREFEGLYGPIREEFKSWLKEIGVETAEIGDTSEAKKIERELKKILEDIPKLSEFFGFRTPRPVLAGATDGSVNAEVQEGTQPTSPDGPGHEGITQGPGVGEPGENPGPSLADNESGTIKTKPISRKGHRGPKIGFRDMPETEELARVEGNNIIINSAHPSYLKIKSNVQARRFFSLFSIASAIQRFFASEDKSADLMFIDKMMSAWGKK